MDGIAGITSQFDPRLAALLGWVTLVVKVLVDWLKTAVVLPRWAPPLAAFGSAAVLLPLLGIALGIEMTAQLAAQAVILALVATVLAIGTTALQARTLPSDAPASHAPVNIPDTSTPVEQVYTVLHENCMRPAGFTTVPPVKGATLSPTGDLAACETCQRPLSRIVCKRRQWVAETDEAA